MNTNITPKVCLACDRLLEGKQQKYCSRTCHNADSNVRLQSYTKQQERATERKLHLIATKGGRCQRCGYNRNTTALEFHHRDPTIKLFGLDSRQLSNRKLELIMVELEKCDLLCSNCHAEIHHPEAVLVIEGRPGGI